MQWLYLPKQPSILYKLMVYGNKKLCSPFLFLIDDSWLHAFIINRNIRYVRSHQETILFYSNNWDMYVVKSIGIVNIWDNRSYTINEIILFNL